MNLDPLLRPRSIAVLGASERPSTGRSILAGLDGLGFDGGIYPVNPRYEEILGRRCYPSLRDLPEAPDLVAFCVAAPRILENIQALADRSGRGAVIYGGGFAEAGEEGRRLQDAIAGISREAGIALCGPNCMGIVNPHAGSSSYMQPVRDPAALRGNVGLISQSGSICIGMLADVRRFGYSLVVSTGNEAVIGAASYLEWLVDDPNTAMVALFVETVREPQRFVAALDRAAAAGKPVVVLKVGQTERTRRAITTHTGGLAGEARVLSEVLRAHRAIEVSDLDEMTEVLAVCQGKRLPAGRRLGVVTASGGQAELILDLATAAGLALPPLPEESRAEVERVVGPITGDGNPLDAWGNGDYATNVPHAFAVLQANPTIDAIIYCSDSFDANPMGRPERALDYARLLSEAAARSEKPHYLMSMRSGVFSTEQVRFLAEFGIPVIGGTRQGLAALDRMARHAAPLPPPRATTTASDDFPSGRRVVHEADAKRLLAARGLLVTRERLVATLPEARHAAEEIGYPVVLKPVADDLPHRSEHGLVALGLADAAALDRAWERLGRIVAGLDPAPVLAGYLVQEMVADGVEVFAGIVRDPDWGPTIAVGIGGVAVEIIRDFSLRLLPLREGDAAAIIAELRGAALLGPVRGGPAADVDALASLLETLADFAWANRDRIAEIDLNPIKVRPVGQGCIVADALIVLRSDRDG